MNSFSNNFSDIDSADIIDESCINAINHQKSSGESVAKIKYLKDTSYDLFNEIFSEMEFENMNKEIIKIYDYEDFYDFQIQLNSNYNPDIGFFDYENRINVNILKQIPYKATKLKVLGKENGAITVSPNGHFVSTSKTINKSESTLEHYNTVIGNSLILKGVYYFEIKILELGGNTDMCFGIIGRNTELLNNIKYRNYPLCEFDGCYGFNLNNVFYDKFNTKMTISVGTVISIKVNLTKKKMYIYFDGEKVKDNCIDINDSSLGYYPAFSLSSGKEIQVKFGGMYNLDMYFEVGNQIDAKPICQYNNLEKIVSCYLKIIDNCLIKIINHQQISYNDSIQYFYPIINFFANIAFNDEYIMKKYILKFMYKKSIENKDFYKYFDERFNFLYLIINNIDKKKQQKSILFLLDCLCEEIKNESHICGSNEKIINIVLYIKLYNYFLKKNLIKEILIPNGEIGELVYEKMKYQLFLIFQSIKICGTPQHDVNHDNIMDKTKDKMSKFINNQFYIECLTELIDTLLGLKLENENNKMNKIDELIMKLKIENQEKEGNKGNKDSHNEKQINLDTLEKYLLKESKGKELLKNKNKEPIFIKNRKLEYNPYRKIFFDLINDNFENQSDYNSYNIISTIFIPLLNLYNNYYEKENFGSYSKEKILTYLPLLSNNTDYLNSQTSKLLINEKISIADIININILFNEVNQKKYNISSYLLEQIINLSSFFEKELFDFDLYLQNREYKKIINIWEVKSNVFELNNYIVNLKKLIYLSCKNNVNIIKTTLESLIPYFTELLNNNFYMFLPFKVINMLKFFIKVLSYHYFIFNDGKVFKYKITSKLIQLFVDLNLKLLYDKMIISKFFFNVFDNIKFIYNLFSLIKRKNILPDDNDSEDEINASDEEDKKEFDYYLKDGDLENITKIIKIYFEKNDKSIQKYLLKFLMYFNHGILSNNISDYNIFSSFILKNIETGNNNFWFKTFIIDLLVKKKIIVQIHKTENILNIPLEQIEGRQKEKLKKYFNSIAQILNFISDFIDRKRILKKYFNFYLEEVIMGIKEIIVWKKKIKIYLVFIVILSMLDL